jgi:hypothetical protein
MNGEHGASIRWPLDAPYGGPQGAPDHATEPHHRCQHCHEEEHHRLDDDPHRPQPRVLVTGSGCSARRPESAARRVPIFLDKNRRYTGRSQSKRPPNHKTKRRGVQSASRRHSVWRTNDSVKKTSHSSTPSNERQTKCIIGPMTRSRLTLSVAHASLTARRTTSMLKYLHSHPYYQGHRYLSQHVGKSHSTQSAD